MVLISFFGESGGSVVEHQTPEREVGCLKPTSAVLCILEQETLLPESGSGEKLLTGTLSLNTNKNLFLQFLLSVSKIQKVTFMTDNFQLILIPKATSSKKKKKKGLI